MSDSPNELSYAQELEQRIDSLIDWAITHQPHTITTLVKEDFIKPRELFSTIAKSGGNNFVNHDIEPSEGGAQYINDNPAPWP